MGLLDTSAFVLSNRGMQMEQVAIVSVLGSLYGAVTVGLAVDLFERTCCEVAVGRHCHYFLGDFFDQSVERASAFQISPPVKLHAEI